MARRVTLLELVNAVAEYSSSDAELIATVVYMVNQGHVRLCGTFKGARFDLRTMQPEEAESRVIPFQERTARCRDRVSTVLQWA
jgi:hypothetical protein